MNRPTYRAMAVLNAGPFQIARSSRPKTSAEAAIRGPGDPRRASRVSPAAPPIAPIACTPRSRPISPGPPCRRRATNRMNSTTKMPCAISATPATTSPTRTPIVTQRPQERARARARRRLVRRRGLAALCWMGFALGALSGRQARDQPRRGPPTPPPPPPPPGGPPTRRPNPLLSAISSSQSPGVRNQPSHPQRPELCPAQGRERPHPGQEASDPIRLRGASGPIRLRDASHPIRLR